MAHKTLIGGTAYEISGGKTLVNGTAYEIDKGKTLIGGTAYEVGFVSLCTVDLGSYVDYTRAELIYNNQSYFEGIVDVPVGTVLNCKIYEEGDRYLEDVRVNIYLNGTVVATEKFAGRGTDSLSYQHTITTNTTVTREYSKYSYCNIYITEE